MNPINQHVKNAEIISTKDIMFRKMQLQNTYFDPIVKLFSRENAGG